MRWFALLLLADCMARAGDGGVFTNAVRLSRPERVAPLGAKSVKPSTLKTINYQLPTETIPVKCWMTNRGSLVLGISNASVIVSGVAFNRYFAMSHPTEAGVVYYFESTTNLNGPWLPATYFTGNGNVVTSYFPMDEQQRYWRVRR